MPTRALLDVRCECGLLEKNVLQWSEHVVQIEKTALWGSVEGCAALSSTANADRTAAWVQHCKNE